MMLLATSCPYPVLSPLLEHWQRRHKRAAMSHTSPASYLFWAILTTLTGSFLVWHLWHFDRFRCLKLNSSPHSGAFKRIMTYTYLLCIPLVAAYTIGFTIIKYKLGFMYMEETGVVPVPHEIWPESYKSAILPLTLCFSIAWSFELITHLEELCFWLFVVNAGCVQRQWFKSAHFRAWAIGSCTAIIYMPLLTIFTRDDPDTCEASTFLGGSIGGLIINFAFTPVLWAFPSFLQALGAEGADAQTIIRLTKFHELNIIRIVFRYMMVLPFFILGIDGLTKERRINSSMAVTDVLASLGGLGCTVSSAITLVIFFPRSIETEIHSKESRHQRRSRGHTEQPLSQTASRHGKYLLTSSPVEGNIDLPDNNLSAQWAEDFKTATDSPNGHGAGVHVWMEDVEAQVDGLPTFCPNRKNTDGTVDGGAIKLTQTNLTKHNQTMSKYNHLVHNYTSPIDLNKNDLRFTGARGYRR